MSITDVIKYEGNNQTFIWKHPSEDFNTGSQLIVHETQEAISSLMARPWIRLDQAGMNLKLKIYRY